MDCVSVLVYAYVSVSVMCMLAAAIVFLARPPPPSSHTRVAETGQAPLLPALYGNDIVCPKKMKVCFIRVVSVSNVGRPPCDTV